MAPPPPDPSATPVELAIGPGGAGAGGTTESVVGGIRNDPAGVALTVVGGDSYVRLAVDPGHTATVAGYQGEPYLRVDPDGSVWVNSRSPAAALNDDAYGAVEVPATADATATPVWMPLGTGGAYAWHDHRAHWMTPDVEPVATSGDKIQDWTIPLVVDGRATEAYGSLLLRPDPSPVPFLVVAVVVATLPFVVGRTRPAAAALASTAVAAVAAAATALAGWLALAGAPRGWLAPAMAALAVATAIGALVRPSTTGRWWAAAASVALSAGVLLSRVGELVNPVLVTVLPPVLERATVAVGLGAVGAASVGIARVGDLRVRRRPRAA